MSSTITALTSGGGLAMAGDTSGQLQLLTNNGTAAVTIDTSQNVGIGTASPSTRLDVRSSQPTINAQATTNGNAGLLQLTALSSDGSNTCAVQMIGASIGTNSASNMIFKNDGGSGLTERMRIDSSGNLLLGTSTIFDVGVKFTLLTNVINYTSAQTNAHASSPYGQTIRYTNASPNNTSNEFFSCQDSTGLKVMFRSNGGLANYSANNVNLSDQREKKDIELAGNYLDKVCAIPVKTFLFNDQTDTDLNLGVIAQEVQSIAPELVSESNWGTKEEPKMRLSIYQTDLQYALMKAIQELNAKVDAQAATITELQARLGA